MNCRNVNPTKIKDNLYQKLKTIKSFDTYPVGIYTHYTSFVNYTSITQRWEWWRHWPLCTYFFFAVVELACVISNYQTEEARKNGTERGTTTIKDQQRINATSGIKVMQRTEKKDNDDDGDDIDVEVDADKRQGLRCSIIHSTSIIY